MKKNMYFMYEEIGANWIHICGTRATVKAIYNSLYRNFENGGKLEPVFREKFKFSNTHCEYYGIKIDFEDSTFNVEPAQEIVDLISIGWARPIQTEYKSTTPSSVLRAWRLDRAKARHRKVSGITEMKETRRALDRMPFDKMVETASGQQELAHATGWEVCLGEPSNLADWWNEYQTADGEICYGR